MRTASRTRCAVIVVSWLAASCASAPATIGEPGAPSQTQNASGEPVPPSATQTATNGTPQSTAVRSHLPLSVSLFNKTVIYIKDAYFDPARIHPRQMLVAALQSVARVAPQLRVETLERDGLRLTSGDTSRTFDLAPIDSLWKMAFNFSDIYNWLTGPLGIADPSAEIGFAATNGMLSTLDRRSVLHTQEWFEAAKKNAANPSAVGLTSHMLSSGIGYIRVRHLDREASSELERALTDLSRTTEAGGQLRGVVLDLRGSPGGLLEQAIRVTNLFVDDGLVVKTVARIKQQEDHRAIKNAKVSGAPLVVVVDELTASGAEVIAAALKDLDRAIVVGQRTNGAGTVQVIYELADPKGTSKWYLRFTIAAMLRPSGTPIDLGVVPDVALMPTGPVSEADAGMRPENPEQDPFFPDPATRPPTQERPLAEVSYPRTVPASAGAPFVEDFPIRFAHDLLLRAPFARRSDMLSHAQALAAQPR